MTAEIDFFTPIRYAQEDKTGAQSLLETIDDYFHLGGKKAVVLQGKTKQGHEKAILSETNTSLLTTTCKILSYFTIVLPLIMLAAKAILRSAHTFRLIDPKKKLEKGLHISEDTVAKLQRLMPKIARREDDAEITWLSQGHNLVFKLTTSPNLVFKTGSDERFSNMIKAKEVCLANQLGLLIIPHAKKIDVEVDNANHTFIVEEALDIESDPSANEEGYRIYSTDLKETDRQLAIFVAKTRFNDVIGRNIPIHNEAPEFHGPRRVALIDLEHMQSVANGFIGDINGSCGLIRCLFSEEEIDIVINEARKQGVEITQDFQRAKERRLQEIESIRKLLQVYESKGIVTGKEPIQVDLESLGLDLAEEEQISVFVEADASTGSGFKREKQTVSLRKVTEDVIEEINRRIQQSPENASIKGKRYILLNTNDEPFSQYNHLGLPQEKFFITEEDKKQLWLYRIIQALTEKGHLFKLDKVNGLGYFIQA